MALRAVVAGVRSWAPAVFLSGAMVLNPPITALDRPNFVKRAVQPPSNLYVGPEDVILVQSMNSHATTNVEVRGRLLLPDNTVQPIRYIHVPNRDRSSKAEAIPMGSGYLLSLMAVPDANDVRRGQTFVTLGLTSGAATSNPATMVLAEDYISSSEAMGWPGSPVHGSIEGVGNIRAFTGTAPAVGAVISETVPTNARWKLRAIQTTLFTSAVAGARQVDVRITVGGFIVLECTSNVTQGPGTLAQYVFSLNPQRFAIADTEYEQPLPPDLWLPQGSTIVVEARGMDAGDGFNAPHLYVEEWLEE